MNIFWLDDNEVVSARYHCDKHVVKMCVEYAQLLSSVMRLNAPELCNSEFPYRLTHKNHPCAIWARASGGNYLQLFTLALALGDEYTIRYGKKHKSIEMVRKYFPDPWVIKFPSAIPTEMPQCMPEQYRVKGDTVAAYRNYYIGEKAKFATWRHSATPSWFKV